ncbi:BnaC06g03810D [Brassica napus]|uniref:BnaC06g03810D protein n=1 Tax=Brassica napus TaxID=3708 RepID=A0A078HJU3_BRANA|nr:BnaC06g03810D [Brassica napus]
MGGCLSLNFSCDKAVDQTCSCLFGDRNYIHMMEANLEALERAVEKLEERRDDLCGRKKACSKGVDERDPSNNRFGFNGWKGMGQHHET